MNQNADQDEGPTGPSGEFRDTPRPKCNLDGHRPKGRPAYHTVWTDDHKARVWADYHFAGTAMAARIHGVARRTVLNIRDHVDASENLRALAEQKLAQLYADLDARSLEAFGLALSAVVQKLGKPSDYSLNDAVHAAESLARVSGKYRPAAPGQGGPTMVVPAVLVDSRVPGIQNQDPPPPDPED